MGKHPDRKARIGILLTKSKDEAKKEEIISLRKRNPPRPWIKKIDFKKNPDFKIDRKPYLLGYKNTEVKHTIGVATDVSVGEYVKHYFGDEFDVDFIRPADISMERLASNDLNYLLIYDLLESFHTDRTRNKRLYKGFKEVVQNSPNVFPNWKFQEFIDSKLIYYNYFKEIGIPICPTFTISKEEYESGCKKTSPKEVAAELLKKIKGEGWGWFIGKPVFGQEAKSCKIFKEPRGLEERFEKYVTSTMKKYPGLIFQKFINGFGQTTDCPEIRMYYCGNTYQFSMIATKERIYTIAHEGGQPSNRPQNAKLKLREAIKLDELKAIGDKVLGLLRGMLKLPEHPSGKQTSPLDLLMTRVDMGCMRDGEFRPWVNEIEFVPSYYMEDHTHPLDGTVGEQMARITRQYLGMPQPSVDKMGLCAKFLGPETLNPTKAGAPSPPTEEMASAAEKQKQAEKMMMDIDDHEEEVKAFEATDSQERQAVQQAVM